MQKPENAVDCWFVEEYELDSAFKGKAFAPSYVVYSYFHILRKAGEDIKEGYIGRRDAQEKYHTQISSHYSYFNQYKIGKKVIVTFDKVNFYEVTEIFPSNPLVFTLKKLSPLPGNLTQLPKLNYDVGVSKTAHPIHFEDLSGMDFERLVYAYVSRLKGWKTIEWIGQTGQDSGRDIWAVEKNMTYCYQCANHRLLSFIKIASDLDKLVNENLIPDYFIVVCGGRISARTRKAITSRAEKYGIKNTEVWNGAELEEKLRNNALDILSRFF